MSYFAIPGCFNPSTQPLYLPPVKNTTDEFYKKVTTQVCNYLGVDFKTVRFEKTRKRHIVEARQLAMAVIMRNPKESVTKVGNYFNKDHATVLHSVKTIANLRQTDKSFREKTNLFFN